MTDADLIAQLSDVQVVALTLFGEARGLPTASRAAVASAILNRVKAKRFGKDARAVCLKPWAFSCWKEAGGKANYETVMAAARTLLRPDPVIGPALRDCLRIADHVVAGTLPDYVQQSTHYITSALWMTDPPAWAIGHQPACVVGTHCFFRGIA